MKAVVGVQRRRQFVLSLASLAPGIAAANPGALLADIHVSAIDHILVPGVVAGEPDGPNLRTAKLKGFSAAASGSNRWLIVALAADGVNAPEGVVAASARFNTQLMETAAEILELSHPRSNAYATIFALKDPASSGDLEITLDEGEPFRGLVERAGLCRERGCLVGICRTAWRDVA